MDMCQKQYTSIPYKVIGNIINVFVLLEYLRKIYSDLDNRDGKEIESLTKAHIHIEIVK